MPTQNQLAAQGTITGIRHTEISAEEIHTRIVLKGCPLDHPWREDGLNSSVNAEIQWHPEDCIYCQQCEQSCPRGCLHMTDDGLQIDQENCTGCGECTKTCPALALEMVGQITTAENLIHTLLERNYSLSRKISQISIGGGEPAMQPAFCADLLFQINQAGLQAILETSGMAPFEDLLPLLKSPSEVRFELICINPELHRHLTGCGNLLIFENLVNAAAEIHPPARLIIRTPLLCGQTTQPKELANIGDWIQVNLGDSCHTWELFEPGYACTDPPKLTRKEISRALKSAKRSGFPSAKIILSGQLPEVE